MGITVFDYDVKINAELWKHFEQVAKLSPASTPETYLSIVYGEIIQGIRKYLGYDHVVSNDEMMGLIDSIRLPPEYSEAPFYWISRIIKNYTLYLYLTRHHPRKFELLKALESENWHNAIYQPRKQELVAFIHNLLYHQIDIFNDCIDRLRYVRAKPNCKMIDYYKQIGIRRKHFVQRRFPDTKLTTVQVIPYFVWNEYGAMFGSLNSQVRHNRYYCKDENTDIAIWLCGFKKWTHDKTIYNYEGVPVRIHHHNLIKYLELPKTGDGYDLRIHPKDWLKENKQSEIDALVAKTHTFIYTEFTKNEVIEKVLVGWTGIRLLRTAQDLIQEGTDMGHCVDGLDYVEMAMNGSAYFFHFDFPGTKGATLGLFFNEKHDEFNIIEFSGYENAKPNVEQAACMNDFLQDINHTYWRNK
jgi:hypothetical protein